MWVIYYIMEIPLSRLAFQSLHFRGTHRIKLNKQRCQFFEKKKKMLMLVRRQYVIQVNRGTNTMMNSDIDCGGGVHQKPFSHARTCVISVQCYGVTNNEKRKRPLDTWMKENNRDLRRVHL